MASSTIHAVSHRDGFSTLRLSCGHSRAIGGHRMFDGRPVTPRLIGLPYDCQDGNCCRPTHHEGRSA